MELGLEKRGLESNWLALEMIWSIWTELDKRGLNWNGTNFEELVKKDLGWKGLDLKGIDLKEF